MINAGKYNKKIKILKGKTVTNKHCEQTVIYEPLVECWAQVKTLRADDLFINDISPEKAYIRFIIRYSKKVMDAYYDGPYMLIEFRGQNYKVQYLHNIDEMNIEIEIKAVRCKYEREKT